MESIKRITKIKDRVKYRLLDKEIIKGAGGMHYISIPQAAISNMLTTNKKYAIYICAMPDSNEIDEFEIEEKKEN